MRASLMFGGGKLGDINFVQHPAKTISMQDGSIWLKSGEREPASTYSSAATVQHLKIFGNQVALPVSAAVTGIATNGSGTWVATYGSTNVLVSTDNGLTWSTYAVGAGNITDVCYNGIRFIVVSNTTTAINCAYSTNGTSWTPAGATSAITGGTADTARIAWSGTIAVIIPQVSTTGGATTTDGSTLTSKALGVVGSQPHIAFTGTRFVIGNNSTGWVRSTDATGATFQNITGPVAITPSGWLSAGNGVYVVQSSPSASSYYTSSDAATGSWTQRSIPGYAAKFPLGTQIASRPFWNGSYWISGVYSGTDGSSAGIVYNSDITSPSTWSVAGLYASTGVANSTFLIFGSGTRIVCLPSAASSVAMYSASFPSSPDFVGLPVYSYIGLSGAENSAFARIL